MNEYKHDILTMEQTTISEIHSYQRPPACVHDVMAATYMLLGHPEHRLTVSHVFCDSFCDGHSHLIGCNKNVSIKEEVRNMVFYARSTGTVVVIIVAKTKKTDIC